MIRTLSFDGHAVACGDGLPTSLPPSGDAGASPLQATDRLLWIDACQSTAVELEAVERLFGVPPHVMEDIRSREGRPKLHDYGDFLYLIFHAVQLTPCHPSPQDESTGWKVDLAEIDILVRPGCLLTLREEAVSPLDELFQRAQHNGLLMHGGQANLLYELLDGILDDYFPVLDQLDDQLDAIEEKLFDGSHAHMGHDLLSLKRSLIEIRRIASPARDVANLLLRFDGNSGGKHFASFQDLYDHTQRILDTVDTYRDMQTGALDAHLAVQSNRMNEVMKTLTAMSIILLLPNLVAANYGMNFQHMPELQQRFGYFIILGLNASMMIALAVYFKCKDWL